MIVRRHCDAAVILTRDGRNLGRTIRLSVPFLAGNFHKANKAANFVFGLKRAALLLTTGKVAEPPRVSRLPGKQQIGAAQALGLRAPCYAVRQSVVSGQPEVCTIGTARPIPTEPYEA